MRRFTDSLLFGMLALAAGLAWLIMAATGVLPATEYGHVATMSVALGVVIATPAMTFLAVVAFFRTTLSVPPKRFWTWLTATSALAAALMWGAGWLTELHDVNLGFQMGVWFSSIIALGGFIALILAVTGAIPVPLTKEERAARKAKEREQAQAVKEAAKQEKAAEKAAVKAERKAGHTGEPVDVEASLDVVPDADVVGDVAAEEEAVVLDVDSGPSGFWEDAGQAEAAADADGSQKN